MCTVKNCLLYGYRNGTDQKTEEIPPKTIQIKKCGATRVVFRKEGAMNEQKGAGKNHSGRIGQGIFGSVLSGG